MTPADAQKSKPQYTGRLTRNQDGTLAAVIADAWGWEIHLTGFREDGSYRLEGYLGKTPEALRVPLLDEMP